MFQNRLRSFFFIVPPSITDPDHYRKTYIINILLLGSFILTFSATVISEISLLLYGHRFGGNTPITLFVISLLFLFFYVLSRKGMYHIASLGLLTLLFIPTMYAIYEWTIYIVPTMLTLSFLIFISGMILGRKISLLFTISVVILLVIITYIQQTSLPSASLWMKQQSVDVLDSVINGILLSIIGVVSWLSNREIEKLLARAHKSEKELIKERDLLEQKVYERTRDLERLEAEKVSQLYRFATLGRMASGLFHDFVNPLTIVSINLRELDTKQGTIGSAELADTRQLVKNALAGTKRLERFIEGVKKQVQNHHEQNTFNLSNELYQVIELFEHRKRKERIDIRIQSEEHITYKGNPVRFSQLLSNVITNALDAYQGSRKQKKEILITLYKQAKTIYLQVQDYGRGIDDNHIPHLFEPLFTTKSQKHGTGLGLSIVQDIVTHDLHGTIDVISKKGKGTTFTIQFPRNTK